MACCSFVVGKVLAPGRITLLAVSYDDKPPLPFKNEREYFGNALHIMLRCMTLLFVLLIFPLAVFFTLFCFKVCIIGIWIAASISAVIMFLILKMLLDFLLNVKFAGKRGDF